MDGYFYWSTIFMADFHFISNILAYLYKYNLGTFYTTD